MGQHFGLKKKHKLLVDSWPTVNFRNYSSLLPSSELLSVALLQVKFQALWPARRLFTIVVSLKRKRSVLSIKDKNEVADNIIFQKVLFYDEMCRFLSLISFVGFCSTLIVIFNNYSPKAK